MRLTPKKKLTITLNYNVYYLLYIKERAGVLSDLYIYSIIKSGFNYVSEY